MEQRRLIKQSQLCTGDPEDDRCRKECESLLPAEGTANEDEAEMMGDEEKR